MAKPQRNTLAAGAHKQAVIYARALSKEQAHAPSRTCAEARPLLGFVLSNCSWRDGHLTAAYRHPFDLLAKNVIAIEEGRLGRSLKKRDFDNWLPGTDSNRRPSD